jgi:D-psicose/D-tagatose/L-ribulose 3-epimerase
MTYRFRQSICNEVFEGWNFADSCKAIRRAGYDGIEIAPFTLNENPALLTTAERTECRRIMDSEGLEFVGLHWLMVSPKGLHVTTPDDALRTKSWRHIHDLIDLCADLGGPRPEAGIMVFGSPKQRATTGGTTSTEAAKRWQDGLAAVAPHAAERRVTILVEALPSKECDVVNTVAEAARIVGEIGSPAIQTMFDTHNAADETEPHAAIVDRYLDIIRHIHVNEMDGRHPGTGTYDFKPIFDVLRRRRYSGWVSLEVFDFKAGAEHIAASSLRYLESEIGKMAA